MYDLLLSFLSNKTNINSIGLFFDVVGVLFIAYSFKNIRREKDTAGLLGGDDSYQQKQNKDHRFLIKIDRTGTILLVVGFGLQIYSNYM
jgi:hypothetical protein